MTTQSSQKHIPQLIRVKALHVEVDASGRQFVHLVHIHFPKLRMWIVSWQTRSIHHGSPISVLKLCVKGALHLQEPSSSQPGEKCCQKNWHEFLLQPIAHVWCWVALMTGVFPIASVMLSYITPWMRVSPYRLSKRNRSTCGFGNLTPRD